jgi:hypothetical protein
MKKLLIAAGVVAILVGAYYAGVANPPVLRDPYAKITAACEREYKTHLERAECGAALVKASDDQGREDRLKQAAGIR